MPSAPTGSSASQSSSSVNRREFDVVIIGSGQAGKPLARAFAAEGRKTALIEKAYIGGTCINVGCTPTKTMVAAARVAYLARRSADFGVTAGPVKVDQGAIRRRKQEIVESFRDGSRRRLESTENLSLFFGEGRFLDARTVAVRLNEGGEALLRAPLVIINTGCRPADPVVPGLSETPRLDSSSIMDLDETPEHLLVMGGGYIGLEFAQMFRRFGSRVTVVQRGAHLLSREDDDVAGEVARILREDGIEVLLGARVSRAGRAGNGVALTVVSAAGERSLEGSHLLVAVGRVPNTEALNLPAAGVTTGEGGFIEVNDRLQTSARGIYALGDVKGGPAFTHISYDDFRILKTNLIDGGSVTPAGRLVPYTVFLDPQLGRVGMTETEARAAGREIRVAKIPMSWVARAIEMSETRGFMKAVVDAKSGEILGAAVLGIEGGEMMAMFQLAMMGKIPYPVLKETIFAHPTLAEGINNLFLAMDG